MWKTVSAVLEMNEIISTLGATLDVNRHSARAAPACTGGTTTTTAGCRSTSSSLERVAYANFSQCIVSVGCRAVLAKVVDMYPAGALATIRVAVYMACVRLRDESR